VQDLMLRVYGVMASRQMTQQLLVMQVLMVMSALGHCVEIEARG
jgi:hypothetical protein